MDLETMRERVAIQVRSAIQHSGIDLGLLSSSQLDILVNKITAGVLLEVDDLFAKPVPASAPSAPDEIVSPEEQVIWSGRPFMAPGDYVEVTTERVRLRRGLIFNVNYDQIKLTDIKAVLLVEHPAQGLLGLADVLVRSTDGESQDMHIPNVREAKDLQEIIARAAEAARGIPIPTEEPSTETP